MFTTVKNFLFGSSKCSKPIRRTVRLGLESLEAREVPASCADLTKHIPLLQGKEYKDLVVASYTLGANDTSTKDDYLLEWTSPNGWSAGSTAELHKDGHRVYVTDDIKIAQEGAHYGSYRVVFRKKTSDTLVNSQITFDTYNANVNTVQGSLGDVTGVNGTPTNRQLLAIFFDERLGDAAQGTFNVEINWGDNKTSMGEVQIVGNRVDVYGSHLYEWDSTKETSKFRTFTIKITAMEDGGGWYPRNSKFCSMQKTICDAQKDQITVGGMSVFTTSAKIASTWWVDKFGENTDKVMSALDQSWATIAGDQKDGVADKWMKLSMDPVANQKMLVSTVTSVLSRTPKANSTQWLGIMQEALKKAASDSTRTLDQIAFDVAMNKLVGMVKDKLAGVNVEIAGITTLSRTGGIAGLTDAARKGAEQAAKSISNRSMLERYLKAETLTINPSFVSGKAVGDVATLTAANLDLVLKATTGAALAADKAGIANWMSLEALTAQRLGRPSKFGDEIKGKELNAVLAALADGSTGIIHVAGTKTKPDGALLNFVKLNGQVFVLDARLGSFTSLNATTSYQMLNTTK